MNDDDFSNSPGEVVDLNFMESPGAGMHALDTRTLRNFIAVAEERHFGRAAERLHMAQPPLSQTIKRLEKNLGTQLLVRTTRRVELNAPGELLLSRGRQILSELDALARDVRRVGLGLEGSIRLGFTGSSTYGIMPEVIRATNAAFDHIDLLVSGERLTPALERELLARKIDIAVLRPPLASGLLQFSKVAEEPLVAALPPDSPLADLPHLALEDLAGVTLLGYPEDAAVTRVLNGAWSAAGIQPQHAHRVPETSTLLSLVSAGMGAAIVPASAQALQLGGVFRKIVDAPSTTLAIAWRRDETSPAVMRFLPFLAETIQAITGAVRDEN